MASPPTASLPTGTASQAVTFTAGATDADGDSLGYTWDFGDGTTGTGASAAHVYTTPGIYSVTVTVSDGTTTTTEQTDYVVSAAESPIGDDNGGDNTWITGATNAFTITKCIVALHFTAGTKDTLLLYGTLPISKFFKPIGKSVSVAIGGLTKNFALNAKGQGTSGACRFQMTGKMRKGVFKATPAKFALTVKGEPLLTALQEFGFANTTTAKAGKQLDVTAIVLVDMLGYENDKTVTYKAKAGKTGLAK
jgi:PKD repeat protein